MPAINVLEKRTIVSLATIAAIGIGAGSALGARHGPTIETVDFAKTVTATTPAFDASLAPVSDAEIKEFRIPITDERIEIADNVSYDGWTFGGTVPGPVIRARVGDKVRVNVVNESPMPHSIDFHAAQVPANVAYRTIMPNDSISFEFTPRVAGAFMVHCGTPPVTMHLMQGMYFAMIVDPADGWGTKADKEFVLVQSEFYSKPNAANGGERSGEGHDGMNHGGPNAGDADDVAKGVSQAVEIPAAIPDYNAAMKKDASYVVFNGRAFQYKANPLKVDEGDRVRFFVVNAGPSFTSDFHIVGAIFDRVYPDGDPAHVLEGVQTYGIPAGGGVVFEAVFDKDASGTGLYPFVTHAFADAEKGAVGIIQVGTPTQFATMSH
jgi:nitrite reductase (NO-forming)